MLGVGNIVKIKNLDIHGSYPSGICTEMLEFSGRVVIIKRVCSQNNYRIFGDDYEYSWNEEMFENGDKPFIPNQNDLPLELNSDIFGKMILEKITNDVDYPFDLKLKDGDVISVTKDFKFFKDSKKNIF